MANVLKQIIEGNLKLETVKKQLADGKFQDVSGDLSFKSPEFISFFLNYIREASSHFTSELPVISPKKLKNKKQQPRRRTPVSSDDSSKSSIRGSLFSTPSSANKENISISPVTSEQTRKLGESSDGSGSSVANQYPVNSSSGKARNLTSTPVKISLEDFPPVGLQNMSGRSSKKTPSRRITPTPVRTGRNSTNFSNSFSFENSFDSEQSFSAEKFKQSREIGTGRPKNARKASVKLKLEDFMQQGSRSRRRESNVDLNESSEINENLNCSNVEERQQSFHTEKCICPKRDLVTDCFALQNLAEIHSFCILENLVPNIVVEMCFILQLLTVEEKTGPKNDHCTPPSGYLQTAHNCVNYAVLVLEKLLRIIQLLDKGTLRLLLDNARISEFSSSFNEELKRVYATTSINKVPYSLLKSPLHSVPFQASSDNRKNFISDQAFHCFKKQRDMFYEIVREWVDECGKPGWSLQEKLGHKIRYVVHQKPGLSNHAHFAKLFQSQLIQMCCYENVLPTFNEGESPELVGNLFKSNPEKFFRLQQRLVSPQSTTSGPCPAPGFTETEEFFREFIVAARSPSFNRYLMDNFILKIIELNSMKIDENIDNMEGKENSKLQTKFASCLITLRTLAKFLGYLVFSPYHSATIPSVMKETLITARNQVAQQFDVMFYLNQALNEHRLVLTLPWVIEYLSMVDEVCPYLEYYSELFDFLHRIYRTTLPESVVNNMSRSNLMLGVGLGWLFEIPVLPETMFTKSIEKISYDSERTKSSSALDGLDLVDQHLLYTCCPYLGELRSILAEAVVGKANRRGYMKKIKPICAENVETSLNSPYSMLQTQLEDNFFRNQPQFLKKDVDYIISRIHLNVINMVKNIVIVSELELAKQAITDTPLDIRNWREVKKDEFKDKNKAFLMKLSDKTADRVLKRISSDISKECKSRCLTAVQSLTPYDTNEIVIKTAAGIVHQTSMNKVMEWSHQQLPTVIEKLVRNDMDKMISREKNMLVNTHRAHAEDPSHPFNWFYQKLLDESQETNENKTEDFYEQSKNAVCIMQTESEDS